MADTSKFAFREKGRFPVSIGTSLALEGATDTLETGARYHIPPIRDFDELWCNLRTLLRNIKGSYEAEIYAKFIPEELINILIDDMAGIEFAVQQYSGGRTKVVFYACEYRHLNERFPHAKFRVTNPTDRQLYQEKLENSTLSILYENKSHKEYDLRSFDIKLKPTQKNKVLLLTHFAVDLLSEPAFQKLTLLESHTGALKQKPQWNTKFYNGKELLNIPFCSPMLQIFGDSGQIFSPYPIAIRRRILEIAKNDLWTSATSKDRITFCLQKANEIELLGTVIKMYAPIIG